MEQQSAEQGHPLSLPARISEGMPVHDRADELIGSVQLVYYGGASEEAIARTLRAAEGGAGAAAGEASWGAFGSDGVPPELRARLLRQGYIRIEGPGITGVNCYATAEQIVEVSGSRVQLHASRAELTTPAR